MVEKIDDYTVIVKFPEPTPFWAQAFVGSNDMILPRHAFKDYVGANSRDAPANLMPIGTGPYKCTAFKPGDSIAGVLNDSYHLDNRPYFDSIYVKGGGDAVSAARAVLQTGEYDFAWNLQIEDEILTRLEKGGKGRVVITNGGGIEHIRLQSADPWTEVDGERSSLKTKNPILSDTAVRQALALLVDKDRSRSTSMAAPVGRPRTTSTIPSASARRPRSTSSASTRLRRSWRRAAGSRVPTACG